MGLVYTNGYATYLTGIDLVGELPLDKRLVVETLNDLYNYETFYQRAFNGMVVTVLNTENETSGDISVWVLKDNTPFTKSATEEDINNIKNVWQQINSNENNLVWYNLDI